MSPLSAKMQERPVSYFRRLESYHPAWKKLAYPLLLVALAMGAYFRLEMYLLDRSFYMATAGLAVNIVEKGYFELFGQLESFQAAPIGFLYISKFIGSIFDYSELSLTFAPMVFSMASLAMFLVLSVKILGKESAIAAFAPFALCYMAVFYAGEFKQYSCELFFCILTLYCAIRIVESEFSRASIVSFGVASLVGTLFSYSAIIVIAGVGISLFTISLVQRNYRATGLLLVTGAVILVHFLLWYYFQIQHNSVGRFTESWDNRGGFPPEGFGSAWADWWLASFGRYIEDPLGFTQDNLKLATVLIVTGLICAIVMKQERINASLLVGPIAILMIVSSLGIYPFVTGGIFKNSRLILFSIPVGFMLVGLGAKHLTRLLIVRSIAMAILVVALCYPQAQRLIKDLPTNVVDGRALYAHLAENYRDGDIVYVTNKSSATFRYYNRFLDLPVVYGSSMKGDDWLFDLDPYLDPEGNRIWVVIAHGTGGRALAFINILYDGNGWAVTQENFSNAWLLLSSPEIPFPPGWTPSPKTGNLRILDVIRETQKGEP